MGCVFKQHKSTNIRIRDSTDEVVISVKIMSKKKSFPSSEKYSSNSDTLSGHWLYSIK